MWNDYKSNLYLGNLNDQLKAQYDDEVEAEKEKYIHLLEEQIECYRNEISKLQKQIDDINL